MIRASIIFSILLIISICAININAQNHSVRFNHLDVEDGLTNNMIRDILQDSKGFMWIATWDGLNRYDGYEFKVYKHIDGDSTSLRNNKIYRLMEDHLGRLWVGTFGGGLSLFNREEENFTNFILNPEDSTSIGSDKILSLFEDSKNRIWIGTYSVGVSLIVENESSKNPNLSPSKKIKFINFRNDPGNKQSISDAGVLNIVEDNSGKIWFAPNDGSLNKLVETSTSSPEDYKFARFLSDPGNGTYIKNSSFDFIVTDSLNRDVFWLVDYYKGLMWFDIKTGKFSNDHPHFKFPVEIPKSQIESILITGDGNCWFGTYGNGIYTYKPGNTNNISNSIEHFKIDPANPYGIESPNITNLYEDNSGLVWIGTNVNGLYTYQKRTQGFINYYHNNFDTNSLTGDNVLSVLEDKEGNVWIGTELGLDKYDPLKKKYTHFKSNPRVNGTISSNVVYSLLQDDDGNIWVGTAKGLDRYNPSTNLFTNFLHNPKDTSSLSNGEIIKLFQDSKGSIWIGTWNGGLNKLIFSTDGKVEKFLHYISDDNDSFSISNNNIMSIAESKNGILWVGTSDGGLNKLISDFKFGKNGNVVSPKFKSYRHSFNDPNSLSNNDVRTIYIDDKGTLWLGTYGGGLNKFIPPDKDETAKFIHYRQAQGLANDVVRGILSDDEGNLWISTAYGLSKFNPVKNSFLNFYVADGLQTVKFEDVSYRNMNTGKLYFGGVGGVISFKPTNIRMNTNKPEIVITSFKSYNVNAGKMTEEKGITEKNRVVLSYYDNILNFEFAALNFYNPSKNNYAYKLKGYNDNWIQLGNKRDVTFTNLDPGKYILLVKGSNNDGVWNEIGTALEIIITPPWWRTDLAYLTYAFLIVLGIFITDRILRRKIIEKERNKAKLNEAELIKKQADELETVDRLVKVINRAEDLENLFNSLLKQTMSFIPQAEKAAVFLLDIKDNLFKVAYTAGYKVKDLEKISFTAEELKKRYVEYSDEIEKGVYIIRNTEKLYGDEKLFEFSKAKSMLVLAVERENALQAFVVFDSFADKNVFDSSAARILNRFREHAVSAISKAQSLKTLQEKNEEIIKTQEQLIFQQKLASLGELTAGIAHEIKNPLNFINNFAELSIETINDLLEALNDQKITMTEEKFLEVKDLSGILKENIMRINNHGSRADSIIKNMLLHSRGKSGEKMLINLNELLDQYINLAYHGLRAKDKEFNITIEKDYDKTIDKINIIPQDISRVFLNIINNAFYAANQKKINTKNGFAPAIKVSTKKIAGKIVIKIWDNGEGIPDSVIAQIFNPFFTTKPSGEGTGLGLSISYDIITKEHNGDLKVYTEVDKYTEFVITLPI